MLTRVFNIKLIPTAVLTLLFCAAIANAQGTSFTYQGKFSNAGNPATGSFDMQFKVFDALTDGTQQGATVTNPAVQATAGIFTVELDFGDGVFDGTARYLEICVRPAGSPDPYTVLAPRQSITSTPYAMHSMKAAAADGLSAACVNCVTGGQVQSIDGAQITGAVSGSQISGEIPPESVPTGSSNYIQNAVAGLRPGKPTAPRAPQEGSFDLTGDGKLGGSLVVNGLMGVGTADPQTKLEVLTASGNYGFTHTDGAIKVSSYVGGSASGATGGWLGTSSNHFFHFFTNNGQPRLTIDTIGNVGIGTATPGFKLDVFSSGSTAIVGKSTFSSGVGVYGESSQFNGVRGVASNVNHGAVVGVHNSAGIGVLGQSNGIGIFGNSLGGGPGVYGESAQFNGVRGLAHNINHGGVVGLHDGGGTAVFGTSAGTGVFGESTSATGVGGHFRNLGGGKALRVDGTGVIGVLEISGGSDLAEHFEVVEEARPGMVVAIDLVKTGKLALARGAYNRRVAGIISGANNLSAGMILAGVKQSKESMPIALSGRVWVYCDAARQAIRPGDLLTTSTTPGHAMKVINYRRAQGAIIGKAMTGLKSGRGLVLVLVSLQ